MDRAQRKYNKAQRRKARKAKKERPQTSRQSVVPDDGKPASMVRAMMVSKGAPGSVKDYIIVMSHGVILDGSGRRFNVSAKLPDKVAEGDHVFTYDKQQNLRPVRVLSDEGETLTVTNETSVWKVERKDTHPTAIPARPLLVHKRDAASYVGEKMSERLFWDSKHRHRVYEPDASKGEEVVIDNAGAPEEATANPSHSPAPGDAQASKDGKPPLVIVKPAPNPPEGYANDPAGFADKLEAAGDIEGAKAIREAEDIPSTPPVGLDKDGFMSVGSEVVRPVGDNAKANAEEDAEHAKAVYGVSVGQVWESRDKRDEGRRFRVDAIERGRVFGVAWRADSPERKTNLAGDNLKRRWRLVE